MTNKLKYFVGNWKMFGDFKSLKIIHKINGFAIKSKKSYNKKIILCIPNTLINFVTSKIKTNSVFIGAQNCSPHNDYGPYTGSINAAMLKKAGAKYIILGHSENRVEGESNEIIKSKIQSALNQKLNVIFCVGEKYQDKRKGKTFSVIRKQIHGSLNKKNKPKNIIIAYEPVWSIGTGKIPQNKDLLKIFLFIKKEFKKIFKTKKTPSVLYGGSVNGKNIGKLSLVSEIDGFLIGGASQSSKKFIDIIKNYYK